MRSDRPQLLVVDDNAIDRKRVLRMLGADFDSQEASTAKAALHRASSEELDCVLLDYQLPDSEGLDTLERLVELGLAVVMLTGQGDERTAVEAMKRGAHDYIGKAGLDAAALRRSIANAMEKADLLRQVELQQRELEEQLRMLERQREALAAKNAELRQREGKLRVILTQLPAVVWTTDRELRVTSLVGTVEGAAIDPDTAHGQPLAELIASAAGVEQLLAAHAAALRGSNGTFEVGWDDRTLRGRSEPMRDGGDDVVGTIGVALDVTDTRRLEEQFRHAQKMEALGQLAGGVAHDFNNLLTAIVGFSQLARDQAPEGSDMYEDLGEVLSAADRGAELVRKLLAFSRRPVQTARSTDVNRVVTDLMPMLRRLVGETIQIRSELAPGLPHGQVTAGELEQIAVNLVVNARDAMPAGGRITLSTRKLALGDEHHEELPLAPGVYVELAVGDDGVGMPASIRDRIFEPFFTTKTVDKGTGLGLSTCYGIAKNAGGDILVYSEPGVGTTFRVYLRTTAPVQRSEPPPPMARASGGGEEILLIEDDAQVRRAVVRILGGAGYTVHEAGDLAAATEIARERGAHIPLILSDVVLPGGTSGPEIVEAIRPLLPRARVLYMSGYVNASPRARELLAQAPPTLQKPFAGKELRRVVRAALDGLPE